MRFLDNVEKYGGKAKDFLYQKGVLPGTREYTRFIVLGTGRTGSNMLVSALMGHPGVVAYGEIFNNTRHDRLYFENHRKLPWIRYRTALDIREATPVQFIEDHIFRVFPKKTLAVGFKFFYWHCQEAHWRCVWDYLKERKDIKILHIKRRNRLKTFLSLKLAQRSQQWSQRRKESGTGKTPISLDVDECLRTFRDWAEKEDYFERYFEEHPMREVVYEELCADYETEMTHIQSFLGLTRHRLPPRTVKQGGGRMRDVIVNYTELIETLRNTEWQSFIETDIETDGTKS